MGEWPAPKVATPLCVQVEQLEGPDLTDYLLALEPEGWERSKAIIDRAAKRHVRLHLFGLHLILSCKSCSMTFPHIARPCSAHAVICAQVQAAPFMSIRPDPEDWEDPSGPDQFSGLDFMFSRDLSGSMPLEHDPHSRFWSSHDAPDTCR